MTMVVDLNLCFLSPFLCFAFRGVKYFVPRVLTNQSWNQFLWSTGRRALSKQQVFSNNPRIKWVTPKSPFSFHSRCREVVISSKLPEKQGAKPCPLRPALGHSSFCYLPVTPATNSIFRKQLRKQQFPSPSLLSGMKLSSDISFPLIPPKCKQCFPQQFCVSSWVQQASCRHPSSLHAAWDHIALAGLHCAYETHPLSFFTCALGSSHRFPNIICLLQVLLGPKSITGLENRHPQWRAGKPSRGTDTFKSGMWFRSTYNHNDFCLKTPRRGCCKVSDEEAPISGDFHEDFVVQTNEEMQTKTWHECNRVLFRNKASNKNLFLWFQSPSVIKNRDFLLDWGFFS